MDEAHHTPEEVPFETSTAPADEDEVRDASNYAEEMARREGFEPPTLRFEVSRKGKK